jgi:hypothetical protein
VTAIVTTVVTGTCSVVMFVLYLVYKKHHKEARKEFEQETKEFEQEMIQKSEQVD